MMISEKNQFPITGREGDPMDLETASQWTKNYRRMHPNETVSHFFGKEILQQLMNQEGNMGIRIYYSNSLSLTAWQRFIYWIINCLRKWAGAVGEKHLILSGASQDGTDQLPGTPQMFMLAQQALPCPGAPGCPKNELTEEK
ncbi:hypothetical protein [Pedobacter psychroterrae]|uniref:Uncharacterized protein n=1 Tax=Pedobacter psychroterrae TaxID=2530453 RepID=A0A4R0NJD4_9SPHI|nr:hypothetical protein [Pedobacter psychroterrae]TCC99004.1 hypothetical protein EZ437_17890 [Pedobacter psychroterrae]